MISSKINFSKLLRSTALTLLFIPGVSAMNDWEGWEDPRHLLMPGDGGSTSGASTSYPSTSFSLGFEQRDEAQKLYFFGDRRLIKGEVPNDGTCFLYTLDMLFPGKGISRDEFAIRLSAAFLRGTPGVSSEALLDMLFPGSVTSGDEAARNEFATRLNAALFEWTPSVSSEELRQEFATELYSQLYQLKQKMGALGFKGKEIDSLSKSFLKDDLGEQDMVEAIIQSIADNDEIIKEMLVAYAQTGVYLSMPSTEKRMGSFGLACQLFDLNLDVYSPEGQTNHLKLLKKFPFGGDSPYQAALFELIRAHVSPLCLETDTEAQKRFAENEIKVMQQTPETSSSIVSGVASPSDPLSFTTIELLEVPFGSYLSSRHDVGISAQYGGLYLPQAPLVHPYTMSHNEERTNFGVPSFPFAARLSVEELNPNLFPAFSETQEILQKLGKTPREAEYIYVVQHDPWNAGPWPTADGKYQTERLLRPQYWIFPDAPGSSTSAYSKSEFIKVGISSLNNAITLTGLSEGIVSSHNSINEKNSDGDPLIVSSGSIFPMLSGMKDNQTSFFVSAVFIPKTGRIAFTFHTMLSDDDFDLLQRETINDLRDLQLWLGNLFQNRYGAASDGSSPYSSWTTGFGPGDLTQPSSSSSSSMPSVRTTFRTTGTNPNARNKHSAISIQLPNQELQSGEYELIVNHRTREKASQVRVYSPKDGKLNVLGDLPLSARFNDTSFSLTPWVQSIREEGSLATNIAAYLTFASGQSDVHSFTIQPKEKSLMRVILGDSNSEAQSGVHVYGPESDGDANDWSASRSVDESASSSSMPSVRATFRTTGTNLNARNKHSAISIQLPNQELQSGEYELIVNHRTRERASQVRIYSPKDGKLNVLGDLPLSAAFSNTSFNITPWVQSIREEGSLATNIAAYLTFVDGQSDIHSFTIQPKGKSLMRVILGDSNSEAQSGIHVYGPESDGDANDWSKGRSVDEQ